MALKIVVKRNECVCLLPNPRLYLLLLSLTLHSISEVKTTLRHEAL